MDKIEKDGRVAVLYSPGFGAGWSTLAEDNQKESLCMDAPDCMDVDHVNGNGLDNRRINLRLATKTQNSHNQRIRRDNTSGFKGVTWDKRCCKWMARIMLDGKRRHLGYHPRPELAHAAYVAASEELHGEFGRAT